MGVTAAYKKLVPFFSVTYFVVGNMTVSGLLPALGLTTLLAFWISEHFGSQAFFLQANLAALVSLFVVDFSRFFLCEGRVESFFVVLMFPFLSKLYFVFYLLYTGLLYFSVGYCFCLLSLLLLCIVDAMLGIIAGYASLYALCMGLRLCYRPTLDLPNASADNRHRPNQVDAENNPNPETGPTNNNTAPTE